MWGPYGGMGGKGDGGFNMMGMMGGGKGGKDKGGKDMGKVSPGDWTCPMCGDNQFARNFECRKCGTPKPDGMGKGGKAPKIPKEDPWADYKPKGPSEMPDVTLLELPLDSKLLATGLCQNPIVAIEHEKLDIFSEAHFYLQDLVGEQDMRQVVEMEHAMVDAMYPEILQSWTAAGKYEQFPTLAKCPQIVSCALGMGSKKNGERAAKLAMSFVLAKAMESTNPAKVAEVFANYPTFKQFFDYANAQIAGPA